MRFTELSLGSVRDESPTDPDYDDAKAIMKNML